MKKSLKIIILLVVAVSLITTAIFVVIPLATSKIAEQRFVEALAEAGISEEMWSAGKIYSIPLLGQTIVDDLIFGDRTSGVFLEAKKVILALDTSKENIIAGSVDVRDALFSADSTAISVRNMSVNDFCLDKDLYTHSPIKAIKKFGNIRMSEAVFKQREQSLFSVGKLNVDLGYVEGKIPLSPSISLKDFVVDLRQSVKSHALRPEYRLSYFELKNSLIGGNFLSNLVIDGENLFTIKSTFAISLPSVLIASGDISNLDKIDFGEDIKLNTISLTYTDKSLLDHVFELSGMTGGRAKAAVELSETVAMLVSIDNGDAKRFVNEVVKFIGKPEKIEIKTNLSSPVSFKELSRNPFAINLSLSINGGKPFEID